MQDNNSINKRIIEALKSKGAGDRPCAVCGHTDWYVPNNYVALPTTIDPRALHLGGQNYPLVPLICINCGNTHLLNLFVLGFKNLDELIYGTEPSK